MAGAGDLVGGKEEGFRWKWFVGRLKKDGWDEEAVVR